MLHNSRRYRELTFCFSSTAFQGRYLSTSDYQQIGSDIFGFPTFSNGVNQTQNVTGSLFGSSVVLSSDGMRLAIGAPGHDANSSFIGSGAVFILDFGSSDWNTFISYSGTPGEGIGASIDLSGDGKRVAIRRSSPPFNSSVEVYDLSYSTRLGSRITCESFVSFISLSNDGNRVAVSCENSFADGYVEIFEWNEQDWNSIGKLSGTVNGSEFGHSSVFNANGTRLSICDPMHSAEGFQSNGLIRVFDQNISSLSWVQIGDDLVGNASFDRLGDAFALSGSGTTIAASARSGGVIRVFKLVEGVWEPKGSIEGILSRAVSLSHDGNTLAADMINGEIMMFEFNGTNWTQVNGLIDGIDVEGNSIEVGHRGLSLSSSGNRIASGSQFANNDGGIQTGVVRVFEVNETSQAPIQSPVTSDIPSNYPSPSFMSDMATEIPTASLDKFSWDIERMGVTVVSFDDNSTQSEISISYNISRRSSMIQIFRQDCLIPVGQDVVSVSKNTTIISSTNAQLDIILDIQQGSVIGSSIWREGNSLNVGYIELCIRTDLTLDDDSQTSVSFHEQKLFLTISLSQGFQVSEVNLERNAADEESSDIVVDYGIKSCQCNSSFQCEETILVQGDDVFICIYTDSVGIEISMIEELSFSQGSISISAIENNTADALSTIQKLGTMVVARSQLRSLFFDTPEPDNLVVNGRALITFVNESVSNRNLHVTNTRIMQKSFENQEDVGFGLNLILAPRSLSDGGLEGPRNSNIVTFGIFQVVCVLVVVAAAVASVTALFIWKQKKTAKKDHDIAENV